MRRQGNASMQDNLADAQRLAELFRTLSECVKPTIARVHAAAMGGGMGLAPACDICIASTTASFAPSEVKLGIIPAVISPSFVRALGQRQSSRFFHTAETIPTSSPSQIGLSLERVAHEPPTHTGAQE